MQWSAIHQIFISFRRRRMKAFYDAFQPSAQTHVLDIGGTPNTWTTESDYSVEFPVTLVNIRTTNATMERFENVCADATDLPFADGSFEILFSNSVIEHMTSWDRQQMFAAEARRVARKLWVQTPARSFPVESHMLAPFFQYLPLTWQRRLARRFTLRGLLTKPSPDEVEEILRDIRLLSFREMKQLFPDCRIIRERFLGFTKSYVAIR
jgi:hypothetical protein